MECAVCQSSLGESAREESAGGPLAKSKTCPACGRPLAATEATSGDPEVSETRIVESTADGRQLRVSYMPARVAHDEQRALVPATPAYPALAALAQLPALAWRQPVVRSAVKTGASAVALSVAIRIAGKVLASRGAREVARESLLPALADLIAPAESEPRPLRRLRRGRRARGEPISEVFIYMRRTVRG